MSINRVAISGNLGGDSELRATSGGTSVLSFSVAVNERVKDPGGNWTDKTNWIGCVLFGKRADGLHQYLVKGTKVAIEGKLRWSQWESNGQKRSKIEVVVDEIEFMSRAQQGGYQPQQAYQAPQQAYQQPAPQPVAQQPAQAYRQPVQQPQQQAGLYAEDVPF